MVKRINYEIGAVPSAILFSNSSHLSENPEVIFRNIVRDHGYSATMIVRKMLLAEYQSDSAQHRRGDPIFSIELIPEDREKVLKAIPKGDGILFGVQ
jgi:hypothetical protein